MGSAKPLIHLSIIVVLGLWAGAIANRMLDARFPPKA